MHRNHLSNVLILGGSAEQRIHVAFSFHRYSQLRGGPFVSIECAHEAERLRCGLQAWLAGDALPADDPFRTAATGTLFLDSVASLAPDVQRLLQAFTRRGLDGTPSGPPPWGGRLVVGHEAPFSSLVRAGGFLPELYDALDKVRLELRSPVIPGHLKRACRSDARPPVSRAELRR